MTMKKKSTMKMAKKSPTKKQMPAGKKGKGVASLPGDVAKNMGYTKDQAGNPIMLKKAAMKLKKEGMKMVKKSAMMMKKAAGMKMKKK